VLHFFGLNNESREVILEEFFFLMRRLHVSYEALRCMPISYRRWFLARLAKEQRSAQPLDQYGLDDDTPITRR
jgi:hypothetical protein